MAQEMVKPLNPALAKALARGVTLVTPNHRAARAIRQAFDTLQQATGAANWQPADALALDSWLTQLWHRRILHGAEARTLLNQAQEHVLWREIIASDGETSGLRSPDSLAELAARAWSLLHAYNGAPRLREFALSADSRAFARWTRAFERRLDRANLITAPQLPAALIAAPDLSPADVAFVDFDFVSPALAILMESLKARGVSAVRIETHLPETMAHIFAGEDDPSELAAAAHWARTLCEARPEARIAIVVPELASRRGTIERALAPVLPADARSLHEFSLGRALADLPIAACALSMLSWRLQPLQIDRIGALLLSPWLVSQNQSAAAAFDAFELRKLPLLRPELSLEATIRALEGSSRRKDLADLLFRLRNLQKAALPPTNQPFLGWTETFRTLLDAAGWNRQAHISSLAFQQHRRFEVALDELAALDLVASSEADARQALAALSQILRNTVFAPESTNAPIQILGPLELGGVPFDALWFLGADDLAWPPPISPTQLLPWQLQRTLGIPGCGSTADEAGAQALTSRIAASAATVVFSYARHSQEGNRRPSPLLASLDLSPLAEFPLPAPRVPLPFEQVPDDLTLPPLPSHEVRGGVEILKLQAACAFRAFAERRLGSNFPDIPRPGLDPLQRGILVHTVMQLFWTEFRTQQALAALTPTERTAALARAIDQALAKPRAGAETLWDAAYLSVQRDRLHLLLAPWIEIELRRPPFAVHPLEQEQQVDLGPLTLDLRIDRIDSTPEGDLILDYKTGEAKPSQWQGDRPDEPQVPLYALLQAQRSTNPLAGVAFASLRPGDGLCLNGFAEDPRQLAGSKPARLPFSSLAEQVEDWRHVLTALAASFAAGDAAVSPKSYPETCRHCGQRMLCRLNPELLLPTGDLDGKDSAEDDFVDV